MRLTGFKLAVNLRPSKARSKLHAAQGLRFTIRLMFHEETDSTTVPTVSFFVSVPVEMKDLLQF